MPVTLPHCLKSCLRHFWGRKRQASTSAVPPRLTDYSDSYRSARLISCLIGSKMKFSSCSQNHASNRWRGSLWLRGLNYLLCPFIALQYRNFYMYSNYSYPIIFTYTYPNNVGHCSSCMVCKLLSLSNQGLSPKARKNIPRAPIFSLFCEGAMCWTSFDVTYAKKVFYRFPPSIFYYRLVLAMFFVRYTYPPRRLYGSGKLVRDSV